MKYLLIIVGIGQVLQFVYCCKMLIYVQKKHRNTNARISNLTRWVITSNQSIFEQLNKMNELLQNTPVNNKDEPEHGQEQNKNTGKSHQPSETLLRPVNRYAG